jgi:hypothetical protein
MHYLLLLGAATMKSQNSIAPPSTTCRFGRGRRPRGPTYARGTIRSLFEDQEQATQRTAYDVATRPPCRNLFWGRSFRNNSVCLCRQSIHFEFIGSGFIFVYRITFSFISVLLSVSLSVFVFSCRVSFTVHFVESGCQPYRRSSSFVPSFAGGPFCGDTSGSRCDAAPGVASVVVSRRAPSASGSSADIVFGIEFWKQHLS